MDEERKADRARRAEARQRRKELERMIEDSSLGTPGAQALRKKGRGEPLTLQERALAETEIARLEKELRRRD